jgi:hypothetical protein
MTVEMGLPDDLDRMGDLLTAAAHRDVARTRARATRRRIARSGTIGALAIAAIVPAELGVPGRSAAMTPGGGQPLSAPPHCTGTGGTLDACVGQAAHPRAAR